MPPNDAPSPNRLRLQSSVRFQILEPVQKATPFDRELRSHFGCRENWVSCFSKYVENLFV
jgi:hypothetical protein